VAGVLGDVDALAVGWATVDLDRAFAEFGGPAGAVDVADDQLLGARGRLLADRPPEPPIVLLEPSTEGRLAASLARHGEGPVALYLRVPARTLARLTVVAPASGLHLSRSTPGPFGAALLVLDGGMWGPHVMITEVAPRGTIAG
jgi:hypothetical protein